MRDAANQFKQAVRPVLSITREDPLGVLITTKGIVENAVSVAIDSGRIKAAAKLVLNKLKSGLEEPGVSFGATGGYEDDLWLVFLENAVNFCFWPDFGQPKWQAVWPAGGKAGGGWYSLVSCFKRAVDNGVPILEAGYLAELSIEEAERIFAGENGVQIPLLKERVESLRQAGRELKDSFCGHFINVVRDSGYDAVEIAKLLAEHFPSFRDFADFGGGRVNFFKRAQICANDVSSLMTARRAKPLSRLNQLTAFADYRLPQILREEGVIVYAPELACVVDSQTLIPAGSRPELEIRASTIWGVELLRQILGDYNAGEIDNALWLLSQDRPGMKPYHRTRTIYY